MHEEPQLKLDFTSRETQLKPLYTMNLSTDCKKMHKPRVSRLRYKYAKSSPEFLDPSLESPQRPNSLDGGFSTCFTPLDLSLWVN